MRCGGFCCSKPNWFKPLVSIVLTLHHQDNHSRSHGNERFFLPNLVNKETGAQTRCIVQLCSQTHFCWPHRSRRLRSDGTFSLPPTNSKISLSPMPWRMLLHCRSSLGLVAPPSQRRTGRGRAEKQRRSERSWMSYSLALARSVRA